MDQAIFNNLTAWFSRSVSSRRKALWVKHGGWLVNVSDAQFIFSQDVESCDTKCLFQTEDYFIGCLTVFHARFIDACLKNNNTHKTLVSKFLMFPKDLPKVLRRVVVPDERTQDGGPGRVTAPSATTTIGSNQPQPAATTASQGASARDPLQGTEDERDKLTVVPTGIGMAQGSASGQCPGNSVEQIRPEGGTGGDAGEHSKSLGREHLQNSQDPPNLQARDISTIPHARDLAQVRGRIVDFVIGRNGCGVQMNA